MATQYYVWKYPVRDVKNPDWVELSGSEFFLLVNSEAGKGRYFRKIDEDADMGMDIIVLETTEEEYVKWHNQHEKDRQKKERLARYAPVIVSMDSLVGEDSELTYHDVVADESVDVEETVEKRMLLERLDEIVKILSDDEIEVLNLLFFLNEDNLSERELTEGDDSERMKLRRKNFQKNPFQILKNLAM